MTEPDVATGDGNHRIPEDAWTVEQLNYALEEVLTSANDRFPSHVIGEVADVDHYDFGTFFELRDLDAEPSIGCLAWSSSVEDFEHDLEAGTKAVVEASVDFYPERGDCQLLVSGYWPIGESARYQELAHLREQLEAEGLFDDDRKQPIPAYPVCTVWQKAMRALQEQYYDTLAVYQIEMIDTSSSFQFIYYPVHWYSEQNLWGDQRNKPRDGLPYYQTKPD